MPLIKSVRKMFFQNLLLISLIVLVPFKHVLAQDPAFNLRHGLKGSVKTYVIFHVGSFTTDTLLMSIGENEDHTYKKLYKHINVPIVNPAEVDDSTVIHQFFMAMAINNQIRARAEELNDPEKELKWEYFFTCPDSLKQYYRIDFDEYKVQLLFPSRLSSFYYEDKLEETQYGDEVVITFDEYPTIIITDKALYDRYIFPYLLNYVSKNSMHTPVNIRIPKIDMGINLFKD